jgi:hypothetical protein
VDFVSHKGSIDGTEPNPTAIRLAHAPVREVIAQKAQAMHNTAASSPLVSEKLFTKALKNLTTSMDDKLTTLTHTINHNTDMRIETSTDTLKAHATNIHGIMSAMALEFQQSNHRIHNLMQTLAATSPDPPTANVARLPPTPSTSMDITNAHYGNPPSSLHKGPHQPYE